MTRVSFYWIATSLRMARTNPGGSTSQHFARLLIGEFCSWCICFGSMHSNMFESELSACVSTGYKHAPVSKRALEHARRYPLSHMLKAATWLKACWNSHLMQARPGNGREAASSGFRATARAPWGRFRRRSDHGDRFSILQMQLSAMVLENLTLI